jgi:hypothetical protein
MLFLFNKLFDLKVYLNLFIEKIYYVTDPTSIGFRRYEQFLNLLEHINNNLLIGRGLGGAEYINGSLWQFELSYISMLDQVGVIGFSIYLISVLYIIIELIKISKKNHEISDIATSINSGMIVFLIVNATNPMLAKFDFLWVIFFPLAVVNYVSTRRIVIPIHHHR